MLLLRVFMSLPELSSVCRTWQVLLHCLACGDSHTCRTQLIDCGLPITWIEFNSAAAVLDQRRLEPKLHGVERGVLDTVIGRQTLSLPTFPTRIVKRKS